MSDLISRKALMEEIELSMRENTHKNEKVKQNHDNEHRHFMSIIAHQPTAFDVDKVIEQLDEAYNNYTLGDYHRIVKGGGIDE